MAHGAGRRPRGDYACRALLSLALHAGEAAPTSVRDIAERTGLPQPYLEQILLALKGAGLVRSKRGVGGGYVLARPPVEIRLSDIVSAVDGPITLGDFGEPHQDGACDHEGQCVLLAIWADVGEHMRHHLDGYTLADVAARPAARRPGRLTPRPAPCTSSPGLVEHGICQVGRQRATSNATRPHRVSGWSKAEAAAWRNGRGARRGRRGRPP